MDIGIPKQRRPFDYRVGLTPMGVEILTGLGHRVYVNAMPARAAVSKMSAIPAPAHRSCTAPKKSTAGRR